jgi:nucleoid DNA-binding protein
VTKKEIVRQIADHCNLTQLQTKEIVQLTFKAIVDTLIEDGRIELRNFGVFEVKQRKARKARNPRTGERVDVPPKNVVTFKPGKKMEERVRQMTNVPVLAEDEEPAEDEELEQEGLGANGDGRAHAGPSTKSPPKQRTARSRKSS